MGKPSSSPAESPASPVDRALIGAAGMLKAASPMLADLPRGRIKERPEDFVVQEILAYEPSGAGEHVFVRFTKRDLNTLDAVRSIAQACGCAPRDAGVAGMKDKRAVTTQTMSLHAPRGVDPAAVAQRARTLSLPGIVIESATPHGNKLKTGHVSGNRFRIVVREVAGDRLGDVTRSLERAAGEGVPNAYGRQRFGVAGDNADRARAWLGGDERGPRDERMRRLLWSSLQSAAFNAVLDARVADGTWATPLEGDLLKLRSSGGLFVCTTVQEDCERAARGEVSPTGPIVGARMRWPLGVPGEIERRLTALTLGEAFDLERTRRLGEGSRRALRVWVDQLHWEISDEGRQDGAASISVHFVLPKGGYATTVLGTAVIVDQPGGEGGQPMRGMPPTLDEEEVEPLQESARGPRSEG